MGSVREQVANIIAHLPDAVINIVDVGCWTGASTRDFVTCLSDKKVYSLGIDPIHHAEEYKFTHFIEAAIRNCPPAEAVFYQYSDPMCNSLLQMKTDITHNPDESDRKWYGAHDFERLLATKNVSVFPLSEIIEKYGLAEGTIHFLKVDAQGCDLEVFLSLGRYTENCLFVQMETVVSGSEEIVLYEGQTLYEQERPILEQNGFEVFGMEKYPGASPEADVMYVNNKLRQSLENANG